nr:restriction endonuclease [Blautia obeum]
MEGHDFEQFCAKLLKANGFSNVYVTPGSNDQGIDILAEKLGVKYAIQCKRYSSDVGNKAVQEVFAGKSYYNCHVGVVLTNRYFTQSAKELAEKTQIFLWNRDILNALCENYYKENPSENK